jgi:hypothetical protein
MAWSLDKLIYTAIALAIIFLMLSTIIMPYFSPAYRYAQATCWTNTSSKCDYDATVNTTVITNTSANVCNFASNTDFGVTGNMCQAIVTAGGYRLINQTLMLLTFFLAMIGFALRFIPRKH